MHLLLFFALSLAAPICARPNDIEQTFEDIPLSAEDYQTLESLPVPRATGTVPGHKYQYVKADGSISSHAGAGGTTIMVEGTPKSKMSSVTVAAKVVAKLIKYMPKNVFTNAALRLKVGIFTKAETLTIFPAFHHMANGNCGTSCTGTCKRTCTFDGRKWYRVNGATGGGRVAVNEQNVICGPSDPHHKHLNTLIHEFGHGVHSVLDHSLRSAITTAYNTAKTKNTWKSPSYAMANSHEYMATATSVYFNACHDSMRNTGGMNMCGNKFCADETANRKHLHQADNGIYQVLNVSFTSGHPNHLSGLSVCYH